MAYILGDGTAKRDGRLSLNPIRHIDPIGLLCILVAGFGWAKPVMVNPDNLKNPKVDMALISIAGPISNFLMAFLSLIILFPLAYFVPGLPFSIIIVFRTFCWLNIMLGVFNLIPVPPLDGSKVIAGLLPDSVYYNLPPIGRFSMIILIVLVFTGAIGQVLLPMTEAIDGMLFRFTAGIFGVLL